MSVRRETPRDPKLGPSTEPGWDQPDDQQPYPAPPGQSTGLRRRYPSGVSICSTPDQYLAAMRNGLWVRLVAADRPTLLRFDGEWARYAARIERPPERTVLSEPVARAQLRRDAPVLVTPREACNLLGLSAASTTIAPAGDQGGERR